MKNFFTICRMMSAKICYENGQSIDDIARQAKRSSKTIRNWLKYFDQYRLKKRIPNQYKDI